MTASDDLHLHTALAVTELRRIPYHKKDSLRAWDAADEYLLNHLARNQLLANKAKRILLVNDQFGALACQLSKHQLCSWSDSVISHQATDNNLQANQLSAEIEYLPSTDLPSGYFDLILIKIPKTLALLAEQLIALKHCCTERSVLIAAGMIKHLPRSAIDAFDTIIGPTSSSLTVKKARLIFSELDFEMERKSSSYPRQIFIPEYDLTLDNHANVFSKEQLDIGARFMLEQFKLLPQAEHIIDLGCGNGVLGILAKQQQATAHIHFVDESYMAIDSAMRNFFRYFPEQEADFYASNCLQQVPDIKADLVLCNPPFHQQNTVSAQIAHDMFRQSFRQLRNGGELWVIANRHLNYHLKLKQLFGNVRNIAANKKFVVLATQK
jgi:16S rRNA (guanine1207-N2)-methyltransferase